MEERTREDRIRELKALRAELMAAKEKMESGESDGEASNASIASIRKDYTSAMNEQQNDVISEDSAKEEMYSQYSDAHQEDNTEEQGKTLVRTLGRR